jgi:hypothetical protein
MHYQTGDVAVVPIPSTVKENVRMSALARLCHEMANARAQRDPIDRAYNIRSHRPMGSPETWGEAWRKAQDLEERTACLQHTAEAMLDEIVFALYGITLKESASDLLVGIGVPPGWYPLICGFDSLPADPQDMARVAGLPNWIGNHIRRDLTKDELGAVRRQLQELYEAGTTSGPSEAEPALAAAAENDDEEAAVGRTIPIPPETFLEDLSRKITIHPISVYWLLHELREKERVVSEPELIRFVEDYVSVMVLRLLGHQWPREVEGREPIPAWADNDGIIPMLEGASEPALIARVRARLAEDFGADRAGAVEREFQEITGKPLAAWLASDFFKRHISQFKKRPIAWQLASTASNAKRRGRGAAQTAPAFACLLYYHRLDTDFLPKLRTQYVGPLRTSLQTELVALEKIPKRSADQDARRVELEGKLEELKAFDAQLEQVLALGFASPVIDAIAAKEPLDKWTSRDGRAPAPVTRDAFLAQERRYDPDLNDGVRVNVAPLQRAGLLAADVLAAKDVEKAIADRAEWRADERRWCRKGKLPQPGWWPVAPKTIEVPAIPDALLAMDSAQEATLFVWALLHAAGGSFPRMDVARAFALRCRPNLLRKFAPSEAQPEASAWADRVGQRTAAAGLLAGVLSDLARRDALRLTTDGVSRSVVAVGPHTPAEDSLDPWFRFEARLALRVLATLQPAQLQEVERGVTGDDRKLLAAGAA